MKTRIVILIGCLFLLNSCFLKSLQAFYVEEATLYSEDFLGDWTDNKKGTWKISSFVSVYEKEFPTFNKSLTDEEKEIYDRYKKAYVIEHVEKGNEATFLSMLFTINGKLFADFTPFYPEFENENKLLQQHVISTHSVAKVERLPDNRIQFKWLDESKIEDLLIDEKLHIQHEKMGADEDIVLTATSEELYAFLEKFEAANEAAIWGSSDQITLTPLTTKP
ncbi:MAG: hypothetical protein AAF617_00200 [Bacteroidota bacterium]